MYKRRLLHQLSHVIANEHRYSPRSSSDDEIAPVANSVGVLFGNAWHTRRKLLCLLHSQCLIKGANLCELINIL